mgnify:CR=1 FL=1
MDYTGGFSIGLRPLQGPSGRTEEGYDKFKDETTAQQDQRAANPSGDRGEGQGGLSAGQDAQPDFHGGTGAAEKGD